MPLRFLHCSDIHLFNLRGVGAHRFLNKRLTGGVNLMLRRGKHHDGALFDRVTQFARELEVDRVVITGDLSNLALEQEFEHIAAKLEAVGRPVTVIPGNHDTYTRGAERARRFESMLGQFMHGDRMGDDHERFYPFVQRYGDVALIGVSTAQASLPLYAVGTVGAAQLVRLDEMLLQLEQEGLTRIVLIHHPVMPGVALRRHDLLDLDAFGQVIARRGAELILHGHEHRAIEGTLAGLRAPVPVHGISSATNLSQHPGREASFSIYDVTGGVSGDVSGYVTGDVTGYVTGYVTGTNILRTVYRWNGSDFVASLATSAMAG